MIPIETVRSFHDEMKRLSIERSIIFASSSFSHNAITFATSRPIELINKQELQTKLKEIEDSVMGPS